MNDLVKRFIDIVLSFFSLIFLSPLFLIIAFLIKWDSEGPVFVKLKRISQGREFYLYKFRSMIKDAHQLRPLLLNFNERKDSPFFKMRNDPRITKFGKFLRCYYLDELPQLINVLKGEISLVGPRPHEPEEVAVYKDKFPGVVGIKAGMTGLSQINGASNLSFEQELYLDDYYARNHSILLDLKIIFATLLKFLKNFKNKEGL